MHSGSNLLPFPKLQELAHKSGFLTDKDEIKREKMKAFLKQNYCSPKKFSANSRNLLGDADGISETTAKGLVSGNQGRSKKSVRATIYTLHSMGAFSEVIKGVGSESSAAYQSSSANTPKTLLNNEGSSETWHGYHLTCNHEQDTVVARTTTIIHPDGSFDQKHHYNEIHDGAWETSGRILRRSESVLMFESAHSDHGMEDSFLWQINYNRRAHEQELKGLWCGVDYSGNMRMGAFLLSRKPLSSDVVVETEIARKRLDSVSHLLAIPHNKNKLYDSSDNSRLEKALTLAKEGSTIRILTSVFPEWSSMCSTFLHFKFKNFKWRITMVDPTREETVYARSRLRPEYPQPKKTDKKEKLTKLYLSEFSKITGALSHLIEESQMDIVVRYMSTWAQGSCIMVGNEILFHNIVTASYPHKDTPQIIVKDPTSNAWKAFISDFENSWKNTSIHGLGDEIESTYTPT